MKSLLLLSLLTLCLSGCSRQTLSGGDNEQATPTYSQRSRLSTNPNRDTTGNARNEREFRVFWKAKEDSVNRAYRNDRLNRSKLN